MHQAKSCQLRLPQNPLNSLKMGSRMKIYLHLAQVHPKAIAPTKFQMAWQRPADYRMRASGNTLHS